MSSNGVESAMLKVLPIALKWHEKDKNNFEVKKNIEKVVDRLLREAKKIIIRTLNPPLVAR